MNPVLRHSCLVALVLAGLGASLARAGLEVLPGKDTPPAFAGEGRRLSVLLCNPGDRPVEADLRTRLYQASSATATPLGEAPWKRATVLPGQTVLDSATLNFPAVKAETRFLIHWLDGTNGIVGTTEVLAYPLDLLKELRPLAREALVGVLDPSNQLKPLLKAAGVACEDFEDTTLEDYHGKLAIVGPFESRAQMRKDLPNRIKALAHRGAAVVWIQPPPEKRAELKPSFYTVPEGKGAVVVVQADLVADLAGSPQAQLNLIRFARLALHPEPLQLPDLTPSP